MFEWDKNKQKRNIAKHAVDFALAWDMDWEKAIALLDERADYGEERYVAYLPYGERIYCCAYTHRGKNRRIISLRKANMKEVYWYETQTINE